MLERHEALLKYITECIQTKTTVPVENQDPHIRDNSVEGWVGMANGANAMMEDVLFVFGCYAGFRYISEGPTLGVGADEYTPTTAPGRPYFAEWRRQYYTRG